MPKQPSDPTDLVMGTMMPRPWMVKPCTAERLEDLLNDFERDGYAIYKIQQVAVVPREGKLAGSGTSLDVRLFVVARLKPSKQVVRDFDEDT